MEETDSSPIRYYQFVNIIHRKQNSSYLTQLCEFIYDCMSFPKIQLQFQIDCLFKRTKRVCYYLTDERKQQKKIIYN